MLIIPDTNFLIYLAKYKLWHRLDELYGRYTLLVLPQVAYELGQLSKKTRGKDKEASLLALEIIRNLNVKAKEGYADAVILQIAQWLVDAGKTDFVIATMDSELAKKLKKNKARILMIRQKRYLVEY